MSILDDANPIDELEHEPAPILLDPMDFVAAGEPSTDETPGKRGRKKGGKNGDRLTKSSDKLPAKKSIATSLVGVHEVFALVSGLRSVSMAQDEADTLADSILTVLSHYRLVVSPKSVAWATLVSVVLTLYIPKILAARLELAAKKHSAQTPQYDVPNLSEQDIANFVAGGMIQ